MTIRSLTLLGLITDKMLHDALGAEDAKLVEVLERKGILTRQGVLAMIQELWQRETDRPPATQIRDVRVWVRGKVKAPPWPNQRPLLQA